MENTAGRTTPLIEAGAAVRLHVTRAQVARSYREGDDLVVVLIDGGEIRVADFFAADGPDGTAVLLDSAGKEGRLEVADVSPDGRIVKVAEIALGQLEEMFGGRILDAAADGAVSSGTFSPDQAMSLSPVAVGVPLGLLAVGVAAGGGGGDDGGGVGGDIAGPSDQPQTAAAPTAPLPPQPQSQQQGHQQSGPSTESEPDTQNQRSQENSQPSTGPQTQRQSQQQSGTSSESEPDTQIQQSSEQSETRPETQQQQQSQHDVDVQSEQSVPPSQTQTSPPQVARASGGPPAPQNQDLGPIEVEVEPPRIIAGPVEFPETKRGYDDDQDGRVDRLEYHRDDDGTADRTETYVRHFTGRVEAVEYDDNADGTADRILRHRVDSEGKLIASEHDADADGTAETAESYRFRQGVKADGDLVEVRFDDNFDGAAIVADRIETYTHIPGIGRVAASFDDNADGTVDRSERYLLDQDGSRVRTLFDDDNDGTVDRAWLHTLADAGSDDASDQPWFQSSPQSQHHSDGTPIRPWVGPVFDYDGDGSSDRTWFYVLHNDDRDGTVNEPWFQLPEGVGGLVESEETVAAGAGAVEPSESDSDGDGTLDRKEWDHDGDGTADRSETVVRNSEGVRVRTDYDDNADGTVNRQSFDDNGDGVDDRGLMLHRVDPPEGRLFSYYDDNGDGSVDRVVISHFDQQGRVYRTDIGNRSEFDDNVDGTLDRVETYQRTWQTDGSRTLRIDTDGDVDGTTDFTVLKYFEAGTDMYGYTLHDGSGAVDLGDGAWERLVYRGGAIFDHAVSEFAQDLAGLKSIELAGPGGSNSLTVTNDDLTDMADGAADHVLSIHGGGSDTIRFGGGIYDTGLETGGLREYRGDHGRILVQSSVSVEGAMDPLDALRENLAEATVEMFGLAGITGVADDNLAVVKTVIGSAGDAVNSLTLAQMQNLADIAVDGVSVPEAGTLEEAGLAAEGLTLDISTDTDSRIGQRSVVSLDSATMTAEGVVRTFDSDGDGTLGDREEVDSDYDGTVDRIVVRIDANGDGSPEEITTETFVDGTRDSRTYEQDINLDGNIDQRDVYRYNANGQLERLERDEHADGTLDSVTDYSYHANGSVDSIEIDLQANGFADLRQVFSQDGYKVREEVDSNDDGTADRVDTWTHHSNGTIERYETDFDGDGTIDRINVYDQESRRVRLELDSDSDGTKETTTWSYHSNGNVERMRVDSDSDGNFERTSVDADADGSWDWVGHDSDDDGGFDRVEVLDGDVFASGFGAGQAAEFAGVGTIDLAARDGTADLTLADGDITAFAIGDANFALTVNGGSNDSLTFAGGGFDATDATSTDQAGNEYREYRGTSGSVWVDSDIEVTVEEVDEGTPDTPASIDYLALLLANLPTATVLMFEQAEVVGVSIDNIEDVKMIIGAFGEDVPSLTLVKVQNLTDIATQGIAMLPEEELRAVTVESDVMTLEMNTDCDDDIERTVELSLNSDTLAPTSLIRTVNLDEDCWYPLDGDGFRRDEDNDYDGTLERMLWMEDRSGDGTFDSFCGDTYINGTLQTMYWEDDYNSDGIIDERSTEYYDARGNMVKYLEECYTNGELSSTYTYYSPAEESETRSELDIGADGTVDLMQVRNQDGQILQQKLYWSEVLQWFDIWSYHDNGVLEQHDTDYGADGTFEIRREYNELGLLTKAIKDDDGNGTVDKIVTWSFYNNGFVKSREVDANADGTVDRVSHFNQADWAMPHGITNSELCNFLKILEAFNIEQSLPVEDMTLEQRANLMIAARGTCISLFGYTYDIPGDIERVELVEDGDVLLLRITGDFRPANLWFWGEVADERSRETTFEMALDMETFKSTGDYELVKTRVYSGDRSVETFGWNDEYKIINTYRWNDDSGFKESIYEKDEGNDGTMDYRSIDTYDAADDGWNVNWKRELDRDADGIFETTSVDTDRDGWHDHISWDTNDDGTAEYVGTGGGGFKLFLNQLKFVDGLDTTDQILGIPGSGQFAGDGTVEMAGEANGVNGASSLTVGDMTLSHHMSRWLSSSCEKEYGLTINGDENDVLRIMGDGIERIEDSSDEKGVGRHIYEGADGRIYVDPEITVEFV